MVATTQKQTLSIIERLMSAVNSGKLNDTDSKVVLFNHRHLITATNQRGLIYLTCVTKNGKLIKSQRPIAQKMSQGSWGSILTSRPRRAGGWRFDNDYYNDFAREVKQCL